MIEVRITQIDDSRLTHLGIFCSVDRPCDTCIREIAQVVHDRTSRGLDLESQLGDIEHLQRRTLRQDIDQLTKLVQEALLELLNEEEVNLQRHIQRLQQILRVKARLQVEGIIAILKVTIHP